VDTSQDTVTYAAFGSTTWHVDDRWSLVGGLRFSSERKKIDLRGLDLNNGIYTLSNYNTNIPGAISNNTLLSMDPLNPPFKVYPQFGDAQYSQIETRTFNKLTGDATLNYQTAQDALLYAKYSTGFRSGGFNTFAPLAETVATVQPESLVAYELGAKTEWLDHHLRANGDVFYYNFTDQQVQAIVGSTAGTRLTNAGKSHVKGAELELEAIPFSGAMIGASVGYTDARFVTFVTALNGVPVSLAGNYLPYAPKVTASMRGSYTWQLGAEGKSFTALTNWSYQSRVYYDPFNEPYTSDPVRVLGALRFTLGISPRTNVYLYSENITNHRYVGFAYFVAGLNASETYGDGRTIGIGLRTKY
jgi:iron complex outermembrane receptor protein